MLETIVYTKCQDHEGVFVYVCGARVRPGERNMEKVISPHINKIIMLISL